MENSHSKGKKFYFPFLIFQPAQQIKTSRYFVYFYNKTLIMKYNIFVFIFVLSSNFLFAQTQSYNVVFDLTSGDSTDHQSLIRWIRGISSANPDAKLEVVFYGQSLNMIEKGKSAVEADVKELLARKAVSLKVCAVAMKHHGVKESDLLPNIGIVPDGIYELVVKQSEGWGYIKVGH